MPKDYWRVYPLVTHSQSPLQSPQATLYTQAGCFDKESPSIWQRTTAWRHNLEKGDQTESSHFYFHKMDPDMTVAKPRFMTTSNVIQLLAQSEHSVLSRAHYYGQLIITYEQASIVGLLALLILRGRLADTGCTHVTGINKNTVGQGHREAEFVDNQILDCEKCERTDRFEYQQSVSEEEHAAWV